MPRRRGRGRRLVRLAGRYPLGAVGAVIVVTILFAAIFGSWLTPYQPNETSIDVLMGPGADHWFGTDEFGRDMFSRTVAGARASVLIAVFATIIGLSVATVLGMLSAYLGGIFDLLFQRLVDTFMALPTLVQAMFFVAIFGASERNLTIVLAIIIIPPVVRVARGSALGVLEQPYIVSCHVLGVPIPRILLWHILPNIATSVLVIATTGIGALILAEAGLSFLGLGITPPTAEWGQMLSSARLQALQAPWMAVFPGLAVSLAVLGFNLLGDAARDAWDPRLRSR